MGRPRGGFADFAARQKDKNAAVESDPVPADIPDQQPAPLLSSRPAGAKPQKDLTMEEAKSLLESLRTASMQSEFQKALENLRSRDLGAFKKRQAFSRIVAPAWKAAIRAAGFSIDAHGFPQLLTSIRSKQPELRTLSEEVERHLKFPAGALFGAKAGQMKISPAAATKSRAGAFSRVAAQEEAAPREEPALLRARPLNRGEAKDLLRAFKDIVKSDEVQSTLTNMQRQGQDHFNKMLPLLIGQLFNPVMTDFEYPTTEAGYHEMCHGIQKFSYDYHVKVAAHEVERHLRMPLGTFFFIPGEEGEQQVPGTGHVTVGSREAHRPAEPTEGEFKLVVRHAVENTELKVVLPVGATWQAAKEGISRLTGRDDILKRGRLVQKRGGTYSSYRDSDPIGETRQVLVLGADISTDAPEEEEPPLVLPNARAQEQQWQPPVHPYAAQAPPAPPPEPPKPTLTKQQALNLQKDLLAGFSDEGFQRKLKELMRTMETGLKFQRERQKLFLTVQSIVLPRYGFEGTPKGVFDMMQAFSVFGPDPDIASVGYQINILLGMAEPPPQQEQKPEPPAQPVQQPQQQRQPQPPPPPPPAEPEPPPPPPPPPPPKPEKPPEEVEVVVEHAIDKNSATLKIMDNASMLELRRKLMEMMGEKKLSEVKIVGRLGDGFQSVPDDRKVKDKRSFLMLGRSLDIPRAPVAEAEVELTVYIDHGLGLKTSVWVKPSASVREVKEHLARADASGGTQPEHIGLRLLQAGADGAPLDDAQTIGDSMRELHYCAPAGAQPAASWQPGPDFTISGRWKFTEANGQESFMVFMHEPGSSAFMGWAEGFAEIKDGIIKGASAEWNVGELRAAGRLEDDGQKIVDLWLWKDGFQAGPYFGVWAEDQTPNWEATGQNPEGPREDIEIVIWIDRGLELSSTVKVPWGASVWAVKEQVASDDPTGQTRPQDFALLAPGGRELDNGEKVTAPCEFEIAMHGA